ncbi:hypothetical protein [Peribacillus butanolivorans]|uniref:hypothetical protein n=1 Tax=Peribacillus butanolivorans TaxID=421767 RepID=UPI00364E7BB9
MDIQTTKYKIFSSYALRFLIIFALLASAIFVFSLSVTHLVDILLLLLLIFGIVVAIILFWRVFLWIFGAAVLITIIFCGIAIVGYIGSLVL